MRQLISTRTIAIPSGVTVEVKARKVVVKGPRGTYLCRWRAQRCSFVLSC